MSEGEQLELFPLVFITEAWRETATGMLAADPNPLVRKFGFGPEGQKCRQCAHLFYHQRANRYYKCRYRKLTFGPGSDHRVRWNACALFTLKIEDIAPEVLN